MPPQLACQPALNRRKTRPKTREARLG
jgi:hypothetical protein